jgi:hypothetical protein
MKLLVTLRKPMKRTSFIKAIEKQNKGIGCTDLYIVLLMLKFQVKLRKSEMRMLFFGGDTQ